MVSAEGSIGVPWFYYSAPHFYSTPDEIVQFFRVESGRMTDST